MVSSQLRTNPIDRRRVTTPRANGCAPLHSWLRDLFRARIVDDRERWSCSAWRRVHLNARGSRSPFGQPEGSSKRNRLATGRTFAEHCASPEIRNRLRAIRIGRVKLREFPANHGSNLSSSLTNLIRKLMLTSWRMFKSYSIQQYGNRIEVRCKRISSNTQCLQRHSAAARKRIEDKRPLPGKVQRSLRSKRYRLHELKNMTVHRRWPGGDSGDHLQQCIAQPQPITRLLRSHSLRDVGPVPVRVAKQLASRSRREGVSGKLAQSFKNVVSVPIRCEFVRRIQPQGCRDDGATCGKRAACPPNVHRRDVTLANGLLRAGEGRNPSNWKIDLNQPFRVSDFSHAPPPELSSPARGSARPSPQVPIRASRGLGSRSAKAWSRSRRPRRARSPRRGAARFGTRSP